jgi:iodotyrosine deiodinase
MNFKIEKLIFKKKNIDEILEKSKKFYIEIKERRTVRDFDKEKVDINIIKNAILSAGTAPNGANLQPWHFVVIKNSKVKKEIRIAAEKEENQFYKFKAPKEWIKALEPLGTDQNKKFIEDAPILIAIFEKKFSIEKNQKIKNYYVKESVGIATGILISCLHLAGLCMLTHTPSPMTFLNKILKRPINEKPFLLLIVGFPDKNCHVPLCAKKKKKLEDITSYF